MTPTTQATVAIAVLALLLCLRRRRTGAEEHRTSDAEHRTLKEEEEARAADEAFQQFNTLNDLV